MTTGLLVLKIVLMPSRHFLASLANCGPRWSMIGVSIARSTRSGSAVGPGICRKWRPTGREEFFDISKSLQAFEGESARHSARSAKVEAGFASERAPTPIVSALCGRLTGAHLA